VVIGDVDTNAMAAVTADLAAEQISHRIEHCDVTSAESLQALLDAALETFNEVDIVFANAGIGAGEAGPIWGFSEKDWQWCFNVNLWGAVNSINVFMPYLVTRPDRTHIVITGSGNGAYMVLPDVPIYTATKAAVHSITENLHYQVQMGGLPVVVSALFPGPHVVETGLFNSGRVRPEEFDKGVSGNETGINSVEDMKRMAEEYGFDLKTTHPDEVAEMALAGLPNGDFWLLAHTDESKAKIQRRADMIINKTTPIPESVG
jgi:NAD(P)-dependent dehydrogenase (short-subunit alcohol dehydrogenase family)